MAGPEAPQRPRVDYPVIDRDDKAHGESDGNAEQRDRVGYLARRQVGKNRNDQKHRQHCILDELGGQPVSRQRGDEHAGRQDLDRRVDRRDRPAAVPAAAAEEQVARHGHVVVPADCLPAIRATRTRRNHRLIAGKAEDTDVQEAAEGESQDGGHQVRRECHARTRTGGHSPPQLRLAAGEQPLVERFRARDHYITRKLASPSASVSAEFAPPLAVRGRGGNRPGERGR